jgi:DNA-binding NarL/FixJ family response regulator
VDSRRVEVTLQEIRTACRDVDTFPEPPVYSVLLISSFRLVREAVRAVIERHNEFQVIGETDDRSHTRGVLKSLHPDIIVFDLDPNYAAGIATIREIVKNSPGIKIIALSMHSEDAVVESALHAGVCGYISKSGPSADLPKVLTTVAQGGAYLSPHIVVRLMDWVKNRELKSTPNPALDMLTEREVQVLRLIAEGKTSKEVASDLNLAVETIRTYRKSLMNKLKVHKLAGLVQFAVTAGVISVPGSRNRGFDRSGSSS